MEMTPLLPTEILGISSVRESRDGSEAAVAGLYQPIVSTIDDQSLASRHWFAGITQRTYPSRRVHSHRRGERPYHSARTLGTARSMPPDGRMAPEVRFRKGIPVLKTSPCRGSRVAFPEGSREPPHVHCICPAHRRQTRKAAPVTLPIFRSSAPSDAISVDFVIPLGCG